MMSELWTKLIETFERLSDSFEIKALRAIVTHLRIKLEKKITKSSVDSDAFVRRVKHISTGDEGSAEETNEGCAEIVKNVVQSKLHTPL